MAQQHILLDRHQKFFLNAADELPPHNDQLTATRRPRDVMRRNTPDEWVIREAGAPGAGQ